MDVSAETIDAIIADTPEGYEGDLDELRRRLAESFEALRFEPVEKTLLIVGHDDAQYSLLYDGLMKAGYGNIERVKAPEEVELSLMQIGSYDLIISESDNICIKARCCEPPIPVLLITTVEARELPRVTLDINVARAFFSGADSYLKKPLAPADAVIKANMVLNRLYQEVSETREEFLKDFLSGMAL